jgi:hypothetical protein
MMNRMSDRSSDGLRERIALLRQDAAERPYLADVLLRIVDELEDELARRASEEPPAGRDHSPKTMA